MLARWLGPWRSPEVGPADGVRQDWSAAASGRTIHGSVFRPTRGEPTGAYLVVPGLHFDGIDDPRLDRFCRILASSGLFVLSPKLQDMLALRVIARSTQDLGVAFDWIVAHCAREHLPKPAVFSISFGSTPAIGIATDPKRANQLGALLLFGGFCDFRATVRFAVSGRAYHKGQPVSVPHDPLNGPAVLINVVEHLDDNYDKQALRHAWHEMARLTWGHEHTRPAGVRWPIAERIASRLAPSMRALFMTGCGLRPGSEALVEMAFARDPDFYNFTNANDKLASLRRPITIVHGRDDDVIAWPEAYKLKRALAPSHNGHLFLTGMYGHTATSNISLSAWHRELTTMQAVLGSLVDAPHQPSPRAHAQ